MAYLRNSLNNYVLHIHKLLEHLKTSYFQVQIVTKMLQRKTLVYSDSYFNPGPGHKVTSKS